MPCPSHVRAVTREGEGAPADAAPDRLVSGSGRSSVWNAFSDNAGRFHVGHWSSEPGLRRVVYDETEFCVAGTWESIGRVSKLYAILEP